MFSFRVVFYSDGVVKCGFFRIIDDFIYCLIVAAHAFHKGLFIIIKAYLVKGNGIVKCTVKLHERVLSFLGYIHAFAFSICLCKDSKKIEYTFVNK